MAGLGETRRRYHRGAVANKLRELRRQNGWSQEELADRLGVDRRQVVRLESGRAPVSLEVVEALARAFGVASLVFMVSAMEDKDANVDDDGSFVRDLAEKEFRNLIGSSVDRPGMGWLTKTAVLLTDEHLDVVGRVADAFLQTQVVAQADLGDYSFVLEALFPNGQPEPPKSRSRRANVQRASRPRAHAEFTPGENRSSPGDD
jgi:transcriptional regulator with XRE-family HTH domain